MPRITQYTELVAPDQDTAWLVGSVPGTTNKVAPKTIPFLVYRAKMAPQATEFLNGVTGRLAPFADAAITGGTGAQVASIANHPGIWRVTSGALANSGYLFGLGGNILIGGGEVAEYILMLNSTTALQLFAGFADANAPTNPTDGAWINIVGTALTGKTANNGSISTTVSSLAVTTATWYRLKVVVNPTATLVTFSVYDATGTLLWTDTLATNIPTAAGRETDMRLSIIKTTVTGVSMVDVDWMSFWSSDLQVR